jgi:hypothetical protein
LLHITQNVKLISAVWTRKVENSVILSSRRIFRFKNFASAVMAVCFLSPVTAQQGTPSSEGGLSFYDDRLGYDLLSIILETEMKDSPDKLIRIKRFTDSRLIVVLEQRPVPKEFLSAAEDLKRRAKVQQRFREQRFSLTHRYKLVDYDGPPEPSRYIPLADGTLPPPSEADLDNKISSGVLSVSAVGYDETKTHAVAYVDFVCGMLCGGGRYYLLEKHEAGWRVTNTVGDWAH